MTIPSTTQHLGHAARLHPAPDPAPDGSGYARTATHRLGEVAGARVGIWEVEAGHLEGDGADELFVVLDGRATITFRVTGETIEIGPGDVVRLRAGEWSVWEVHERLRKVYVNAGPVTG